MLNMYFLYIYIDIIKTYVIGICINFKNFDPVNNF